MAVTTTGNPVRFVSANVPNTEVKKIIHENYPQDTIIFLPQQNQIAVNGIIYTSTEPISGTYEELKSLMKNGELIPGAKYRMTNYCTIVSPQLNSRMFVLSDELPFDIILTAQTTSKFDEDAKLTYSNYIGPIWEYAKNLELFSIKYSFDCEYFQKVGFFMSQDVGFWPTFERGTIYYMADNYGNECYYDFLNLKFARYFVNSLNERNVYMNFEHFTYTELYNGSEKEFCSIGYRLQPMAEFLLMFGYDNLTDNGFNFNTIPAYYNNELMKKIGLPHEYVHTFSLINPYTGESVNAYLVGTADKIKNVKIRGFGNVIIISHNLRWLDLDPNIDEYGLHTVTPNRAYIENPLLPIDVVNDLTIDEGSHFNTVILYQDRINYNIHIGKFCYNNTFIGIREFTLGNKSCYNWFTLCHDVTCGNEVNRNFISHIIHGKFGDRLYGNIFNAYYLSAKNIVFEGNNNFNTFTLATAYPYNLPQFSKDSKLFEPLSEEFLTNITVSYNSSCIGWLAIPEFAEDMYSLLLNVTLIGRLLNQGRYITGSTNKTEYFGNKTYNVFMKSELNIAGNNHYYRDNWPGKDLFDCYILNYDDNYTNTTDLPGRGWEYDPHLTLHVTCKSGNYPEAVVYFEDLYHYVQYT